MKIRVGVFFGGKSVEHEVSVISAIQAVNAFNRDKYDVIPVYITKNNELYVGEGVGKIEEYKNIPALLKKSTRVIMVNDQNKTKLVCYPMKKFGDSTMAEIDVAFPIVHGTNVEDGTFQGYLQMMNIPYVGCDVLSSAVGMDKYVMKAVLKDNGIPVLDCVTVSANEYAKNSGAVFAKIKEKVGFPAIVKPINLGSSVGIKIGRDDEELNDALDYAFGFAGKVLVEHAVMNLREINCSVCGDGDEAKASECEEPISNHEILSFEDKYSGGSKSSKASGMASLDRKIPAEISKEMRAEIREMAVKAFKCLGCSGVSRIDFMLDVDSDKIYLNEINTIPGSLAFYLWEPLGTKYSQLLDIMVSLALKRDREMKNINFSFESNILAEAKLGGAKGGKLGG
ncbi:MAG: D-alanine--D-alanine ligase [Ruminococcaceae bacterium]|nr:D-alanine--D-alanine ligase [Oscillospiraceae bacterium]